MPKKKKKSNKRGEAWVVGGWRIYKTEGSQFESCLKVEVGARGYMRLKDHNLNPV